MKLFTQLALVSAIAACASAANAMQSMDDAALSDTTGQDGITILIAPPKLATADVSGGVTRTNALVIGAAVLHDKDGLLGSDAQVRTGGGTTASPYTFTPYAGRTSGGAIILGDANQANTANAVGTQLGVYGSGAIVVKIDVTGDGYTTAAVTGTQGSAPVLNVNVALPADLMIRTGDISIAGSNRGGIATSAAGAVASNAATGGTTGTSVKILSSMDIALSNAKMNIQLGNTPQGGMIALSGSITGGLTISNLSLHDGGYDNLDGNTAADFGGDLGVTTLTLTDTLAGAGTGSALTMDTKIGVTNSVGGLFNAVTGTTNYSAFTAGGLVATVGGTAMDVMMQNVTLGSASSTLGDLELINVQAAGTKLAIMGH